MQKILTLFAGLILCLAFSYRADAQQNETSVVLADAGDVVAYPLSVLSIIDQKCIGCHSPNAKNDKSKEALQWIQLQSMDPVDLLAKLGDMDEVLEEGTMPPEKLLEKYPNMKLTDEETAKLKAWVQNTISRLDD